MYETAPIEPSLFRIRWEYGGFESELTAVANRDGKTVTVTFPGRQTAVIDVVAARAAQIMLNHISYCVLEPEGPPIPEIEVQGPRGGWHGVYQERRGTGKHSARTQDSLVQWANW